MGISYRMNCPRCGFEQHIGATFCPNCGWLLAGGENPDDFWRIENPLRSPLRKPPKKKRRKGGRSIEREESGEEVLNEAHKEVEESQPVSPEEQPVPASFTPEQTEHPAEERVVAGEPIPTSSDTSSPAEPAPYYQPVDSATTPQAPAVPRGAGFVIRPPKESSLSRIVWPAVSLLAGLLLGASLMYILSPPKEYIVLEPLPSPSPQVQPKPIGGLVPIPVPQTTPGPLVSAGPDLSAQNDLRNALIAEKLIYVQTGSYTDDIETLAKKAPEVVWEPGVTPSRPGVVAVRVCGGPDPSAPVLLQAVGPSGRYYGIYDVASGPSSAVYYAMSQQAFNCPNSAPPQSPWTPSQAGWGIQQPKVTEPTERTPAPEPSPPTDEEILGGALGSSPAPSPTETPLPRIG